MTNPDVELAYKAITGKVHQHSEAFDYYDGVHPLVYANERLREIFQGVQVRFTENWCSLVIDAMQERINLTGFEGPAEAQELLETVYQDNNLNLESDDLHEASLVTGEGYVIVWPAEDEQNRPEIFYNDPRLCHLFYQAENPRVARVGCKLWVAEDKTYRMTLYYPERLEYYRTTQKAESVSSASAFVVDNDAGGSAVNPYGEIPVFHYRLKKRRIMGDLQNVIPIQNGINKLLSDMMVAAEYGAFRQRWVISNADTSLLKNAPNEIWLIPGGDGIGQESRVGDFSPTDLGNYLSAIEHLASDVARITRTPKHFFFSQGGDPSGEALLAMEAPLTRKVQDRIARFKPVWQEVIAFALKIAGREISPQDITPVFEHVETVQPETQARIRTYDRQAGIPLMTTLRRAGWSQAEIDQLAEDQAAERATTEQAGEQLLTAFDRGV